MQNAKYHELIERIQNAEETIGKFTIWKHVKTGHSYKVLDIVIIEKTLEIGITYVRYGTNDPILPIWVRPLSEFMDGRFSRLN